MSINKASGAENILTHYNYIAIFCGKSNDATTTTGEKCETSKVAETPPK